ncbi:PhzF family phenazine biosynthesis protein [Pseudogemmobacter humi]|uniref:Trans-2,3-dihydro-3-hydroxyanthranilate isomerase n=1 Tax=Pseudogemmobacter humi TaxID=2483812 RepID=A0A3P5XXS5_9RHOB|nr:PhzF family phenazine biosynthesis protein [Pseudogemmobacter humi]VDC32954.1 Trans-2,3-dihydro-3-hydroxyanthranilate isomerase [Pseudogemmobacter humi]
MIAFHTLDVFTETPFSGNPLAVVPDAGGLSTAQMQTIAREFNLSETIFVMPPRDPAHSARVRIFFPTAEIPFAGHPTIGCAILLAEMAHEGDFATTITLEEEAGLVPVAVTREGGRIIAELTAPVLPYPAGPAPEAQLLAAALGLAPDDLGPHRPGCHEGGPRFVYAPLRDLDALARARATEPHWSRLMAAHGVDSVYLYAPGDGACDLRARMFSPTAGIPEDPATGSASAILAAQLLANGAIQDGTTRLTLRQGVEMGRPSTLRLTIEAAGGALTAVRIAGSAVRIGEGRLRLP